MDAPNLQSAADTINSIGLMEFYLFALMSLISIIGIIWTNYARNSDKHFYDIELTKKTGHLSKEITALKAKHESSSHVSKLQYEKELEIYIELWRVVSSTHTHLGNIKIHHKRLDAYKESYDLWFVTFHEIKDVILEYSPFIDQRIYKLAIEYVILCTRKGDFFASHLKYLDAKEGGEDLKARFPGFSDYNINYGFTEDDKFADFHSARLNLSNAISNRWKQMSVIE